MLNGRSIGAAIDQIKTAVPKMIEQIKELAKAEIKPAAKHGAIATGLVGAILIVAATLLFILLIVLGFALSIFYNQVLDRQPITALTFGFLTLALLCVILIVLLALLAWRHFKKVKTPQATIAETKASLASVGAALERGIKGSSGNEGSFDISQNIENLPEY